MERAKGGDVSAAKLYWDRAYGQAPATLDVNTNTATVLQWQERARDWFLKHHPDELVGFCEWMDGAGKLV